MEQRRRLSSHTKELWIHGLAFGIAAIIGAILVHPLLPVFEAQTDTRSEALGAYHLHRHDCGCGAGSNPLRILAGPKIR